MTAVILSLEVDSSEPVRWSRSTIDDAGGGFSCFQGEGPAVGLRTGAVLEHFGARGPALCTALEGTRQEEPK